MMLCRFVDAQKAEGFPVRLVCSVVGVSPSAYYAYRQRPRSGPVQLAEVNTGARWPRLHSTTGQQPPNEWEDNYYHHTAA